MQRALNKLWFCIVVVFLIHNFCDFTANRGGTAFAFSGGDGYTMTASCVTHYTFHVTRHTSNVTSKITVIVEGYAALDCSSHFHCRYRQRRNSPFKAAKQPIEHGKTLEKFKKERKCGEGAHQANEQFIKHRSTDALWIHRIRQGGF
jgi:hypothetical protein